MVFEFVFPYAKDGNGFGQYVESLAPESGLQLLEQGPMATIVEGEWDEAVKFLRQCRDYVLKHEAGRSTITTIHIHN